MRMRRLSGLVEHFMRRRSSVMRSTDGTSSKLATELLAILVRLGFFDLLSQEECDENKRGRGYVNEKIKAGTSSSDLPTLFNARCVVFAGTVNWLLYPSNQSKNFQTKSIFVVGIGSWRNIVLLKDKSLILRVSHQLFTNKFP